MGDAIGTQTYLQPNLQHIWQVSTVAKPGIGGWTMNQSGARLSQDIDLVLFQHCAMEETCLSAEKMQVTQILDHSTLINNFVVPIHFVWCFGNVGEKLDPKFSGKLHAAQQHIFGIIKECIRMDPNVDHAISSVVIIP